MAPAISRNARVSIGNPDGTFTPIGEISGEFQIDPRPLDEFRFMATPTRLPPRIVLQVFDASGTYRIDGYGDVEFNSDGEFSARLHRQSMTYTADAPNNGATFPAGDPDETLSSIVAAARKAGGASIVTFVKTGGRFYAVPDGVDLSRLREFEESVEGKAADDPAYLIYADWLESVAWGERAKLLRDKAAEYGRIVKVLDRGHYFIRKGKRTPFGESEPGLLDGKGGRLPKDAESVWLEVKEGELKAGAAANSAGDRFAAPQWPVGFYDNRPGAAVRPMTAEELEMIDSRDLNDIVLDNLNRRMGEHLHREIMGGEPEGGE